jgi:hypothetical protein
MTEIKNRFCLVMVPARVGRVEEDGGEGTWLKYFIHMHENRTMKHAEIVLRRRLGIKGHNRECKFN